MPHLYKRGAKIISKKAIGLATLVLAASCVLFGCGKKQEATEKAVQPTAATKLEETIFKFKNPSPLTIEEIKNDESSRNAMSLFEEAFGLYHSGRVQEADTKFEAAILTFPKFSDAHYYRGMIATKRNDVDGAITHFNKAVDCFGGNLEAHLELADSYMKKQENKKAKMHFNAAISIFSFENRAYTGLGRIALNEGNLELAKKMAQTTIEKNPFDARAYKLLGDVYLKQGEEFAAHNNYKLAKTINPQLEVDEKAAYGNDGKLNLGSLKSTLENALTFDWGISLAACKFSVSSFNYARVCGDLNESMKILDSSFKNNPYDVLGHELMADACMLKAQTFLNDAKLQEAIPYLEQSIANDFQNKKTTYCTSELSKIFSKQEETDKAAHYLRLAIQSLCRDIQLLYTKTNDQNKTLKLQLSDSLKKYNWAIWEMSKNEEEGLSKLITASKDIENKKYEKAIESVENAIKNHHYSPVWSGVAYGELEIAHYELGQFDKSAEASKSCLNAFPINDTSHLMIVVNAVMQGEKADELRRHMIMALLKNPQNTENYSLFAKFYSDEYEKISSDYDKKYSENLLKCGAEIEASLKKYSDK